MPTNQKPQKTWLTKLGLICMLVVAICLGTLLVIQKIKTGSFDRGNGFVAGPSLGWTSYVLPAGLVLLLIGGFIDAYRYSNWKKAEASSRSDETTE